MFIFKIYCLKGSSNKNYLSSFANFRKDNKQKKHAVFYLKIIE